MCDVETGEGCPWEGGDPDNWDPPEACGVSAGDACGGGYPTGDDDNSSGCASDCGGRHMSREQFQKLQEFIPNSGLRVYSHGKGNTTSTFGGKDVPNGTIFVTRNSGRNSGVTNYERFCDGQLTNIGSYSGGP
jgi:hypothetical protein